VIHLFLKMARKADEAANFVFVQLIEQHPGIYDKRHPDYAMRDKILWRLLGNNIVIVNRALANHGLGTSRCLATTM
jgi:hypothetical protein